MRQVRPGFLSRILLPIAIGVALGLLVTGQPLTRDEAEHPLPTPPRPVVIARGLLTSAIHEQDAGSYDLMSLGKPGLSLYFPPGAIGPMVLRSFLGQRVKVWIEIDPVQESDQ